MIVINHQECTGVRRSSANSADTVLMNQNLAVLLLCELVRKTQAPSSHTVWMRFLVRRLPLYVLLLSLGRT